MLLSIVTVCYNSEKTIEKTIKSIVKQKNDSVEYIIIDGASKDNTVGIVQKYLDEIDFFASEKDAGISDAFNKGVARAKGDYIWLINSDDTLCDCVIDDVLKILGDKKDVHCLSMRVIRGEMVNVVYSDHLRLDEGMYVAHPATIVSKDLYSSIGVFNNKFKLAMDYDFLIRAKKWGASFSSHNNIVVDMNGGGVSDLYPFKAVFECFKSRRLNGYGFYQSYFFLFRYLLKRTIFFLKDSFHGGR
ncbi:glycosyltransferase family 2 protein [Shewanella baltica]|uniref:glycosyltransferase family 2 protein n=1 Tax=Shewanella baltica TaxID=62322 RepID=UPI00217E9F27|nr:glycosyltransferase family 2 protein [Shewanella baltica]MCS6206980.1 glycosyltransferase [Shewanella baltica]